MSDISQLPKVLLHDHLAGPPAQTPAELSAQVTDHLQRLAEDRVAYVELRISPHLHTDGGLTLQEVIDCAVAGLDNPLIDARLIPTAHPGQDVMAVAELVVANHGRTVVGFDLAGDMTRLDEYADAFRLLRENYVPFTIHAGLHGGLDEIGAAVQAGAVRLGHAVALIDDFHIDTDGFEGVLPGRISGWVRDRHLVIECAPSLEVSLGVVDEFSEHPLTLLQQLGFTCTVNTAQLEVAGSVSAEYERLEQIFGYGLEEFFDLTVNAVRGAFLTEVERQDLLERVILPAYESQDLQAGLDEFGGEQS
ncbi:adenosine deaminase family protein [Corynebacterium sp.]|uniref:adenosine deaminase family protein n=1 Tax=Corynebacterium sp. TaxID=1720 RepID=UPI0026DEB221|nr:adenosine deaminase family protein [Corynebacterium sp.]MDO5512973.1 adenosine deaminase family protein [Corynebacterium sp.]